MLTREEYNIYCKKFNSVYCLLQRNSLNTNEVASQICSLRGYNIERMLDIIKSAGFIYIEDGKLDYSVFDKPEFKDLSLFSMEGNFLLKGRYIFPVKDMMGNVVSLIGWYPDEKKYITTPSKLFSKSCLFYGMEQLGKTGIGKEYILVEGIFDSLSVRSLGFPCVAMMGIEPSRYKSAMYTLFKRLLAIPDNDSEGRKVVKYNKWELPTNSKYMNWKGINLKDIDDLCKSFEEDDMKELIKDVWKESSRIVTVQLG